jgi:hypothetical protein
MSPFGLFKLFLLITGSLIATVFFFKRFWRGESKIRSITINFIVLVFSLLYSFTLLELLLSTVFLQSYESGFSLFEKRWDDLYWKPINSIGYRDVDHPKSDFANKKTIYVVGDSFVAGYGIKDYRDRFANVLQDELGERWSVITIAKNGWGTFAEYNALLSYPNKPTKIFGANGNGIVNQTIQDPNLKPNVIILSYFINDIEDAAYFDGLGWFQPPALYGNQFIQSMSNRSFVFNFVYWTLYLRMHPDIGKVYWDYLRECYTRGDIWKTQTDELLKFVDFARSRNIKLIVVVFPELRNIEGSKEFTSKVVDLMKENNVSVIDLDTILSGRNPRELIVQPLDGHPSAELHKEVANLLFERVNSTQ